MSELELQQILQQSGRDNQIANISGVLLYINGCIIQVLEGEESVKTLYQIISQDPRHSQIIPLYGCAIEKSTFPDWAMGYKMLGVSELGLLKTQLPFLDNLALIPSQQENVVLRVIERFYLSDRHQ